MQARWSKSEKHRAVELKQGSVVCRVTMRVVQRMSDFMKTVRGRWGATPRSAKPFTDDLASWDKEERNQENEGVSVKWTYSEDEKNRDVGRTTGLKKKLKLPFLDLIWIRTLWCSWTHLQRHGRRRKDTWLNHKSWLSSHLTFSLEEN